MLTKYSLYYHSFGAPMTTRNKQVSSVLVKNTLYTSSFTSGTDGWVATSNATLSNVYGNIRATVTALNAGMQKTFSTEAGKTYRIRFKVNLRGWPYMYVKDVAGSTNLISITDFMTPGDYNYTFTATGYQTNVIFHEAGNASGSVQICNFTLEEVEAENGYRFGFNGKENDDEIQTQDYGFRIYNNRLGRFLSVDPLAKSFPWNSTYAFSENRPIDGIDLDGREWSKALYFDPFSSQNQVAYTVRLKVIDATNTSMSQSQIKEIMDGINTEAKATFNQFDKDANTNYTINIIYEIVPASKIQTGEHKLEEDFTMLFSNTTRDADGNFTAGSTAKLGGEEGGTKSNVILLNVNVDGAPRALADLFRTGTHELGHSGGLIHPWLLNPNGSQQEAFNNQKLNIMNSGANPDPSKVITESETNSATQGTLGQTQQIGAAIDQDLAGYEKQE